MTRLKVCKIGRLSKYLALILLSENTSHSFTSRTESRDATQEFVFDPRCWPSRDGGKGEVHIFEMTRETASPAKVYVCELFVRV